MRGYNEGIRKKSGKIKILEHCTQNIALVTYLLKIWNRGPERGGWESCPVTGCKLIF